MKETVEKKKPGKGKKPSAYKPIVPAVDQALKLLMHLAKNTETQLTLTEICDQLDIHKSKGYTLLNTLKQYDLIEKDDRTKTYRLGLGIVYLARNVLYHMDIRRVAEPYLQELARESRCTAHLLTINGDTAYVVSAYEGSPDIGFTLRRGFQYPLTHGVHGRAIAAFLPDDERERLLASGPLHFYGERITVDMKRLRMDLALARQRGYVIDKSEQYAGITAIGSPVFEKGGVIVGCILLLGVFPNSEKTDFGVKVLNAAKHVSEAFGVDTARYYRPA